MLVSLSPMRSVRCYSGIDSVRSREEVKPLPTACFFVQILIVNVDEQLIDLVMIRTTESRQLPVELR